MGGCCSTEEERNALVIAVEDGSVRIIPLEPNRSGNSRGGQLTFADITPFTEGTKLRHAFTFKAGPLMTFANPAQTADGIKPFLPKEVAPLLNALKAVHARQPLPGASGAGEGKRLAVP